MDIILIGKTPTELSFGPAPIESNERTTYGKIQMGKYL